jgi:hypothetical protein
VSPPTWRPESRGVKRKIMIDTIHEIINRGSAGTGPSSRPAGQNAEDDDIWKGAALGYAKA